MMNTFYKLVQGLSFCLLSACNGLNPPVKATKSILGTIVSIQEVDLLETSEAIQSIKKKSSLALVLNSKSPYRLLLADGRVAWSKKVGLSIPFRIKGKIESIDIASHSLSENFKGAIEWQTIHLADSANITMTTETLGPQSPSYVTEHGRFVGSTLKQNLFNWPQLKIESGDDKGWVFMSMLRFVRADNVKRSFTGLIQKPFLDLIDQSLLPTPAKTIQYMEIFISDPKVKSVTKPFELQQAIIMDKSESSMIRTIGLFSADREQCYMIAVQWKNKQSNYFGHCNGYPTPVIIDYEYANEQSELVLTILQISGDEEWQNRLLISQKNGHAYAKVIEDLPVN